MKTQQRPVNNNDKGSFAYKEGYYAFSRGWLDCKYGLDTTKGKEWCRGFDKAYFDNLDRIKR